MFIVSIYWVPAVRQVSARADTATQASALRGTQTAHPVCWSWSKDREERGKQGTIPCMQYVFIHYVMDFL